MKCTSCGNESDAILVSLFDGSICKDCYEELFYKDEHGASIPKNYDRDGLTNAINNIGYDEMQMCFRAIKDIHRRYRSKVIHYLDSTTNLMIFFESKFNKRDSIIMLNVDKRKNKCEYSVIAYKGTKIYIECIRKIK